MLITIGIFSSQMRFKLMNNENKLIYEGKAKVYSHDDEDKVIIEFKDEYVML